MIWPRVIGQLRVKRVLLSALKGNRLAHAYLFYGPEGVGKDAMALELARVMHCEKGAEEACNACPSCLRMDRLQHPDVRLVVPLPVGKGEQADDLPLARLTEAEVANVQEEFKLKAADPYHRIAIPRATIIKINSIREVRRESSLSTFGSRRRVTIISQADLMGEEAANTLLKTLEEPSGHTMLILTTSRRDTLLPTIQSRCQNVRFDPLMVEEIRGALVERAGAEAPAAALAARLANGSYTRAAKFLDPEVLRLRDEVLAFIRHALGTNAGPLLADVEAIADSRDREKVVQFLMLTQMWLRDALLLANGAAVVNADHEEQLRRFTAKFPGADLLQALAEIEKTISLVQRNVYIKLALLRLAVRLKACVAAQELPAEVLAPDQDME